jgi:CRISPR-associated protein Cas5t
VGEENRYRYINTRLAVAVTRTPEVSTVLRTAWRIKFKTVLPGLEKNRTPDYQEILTGLEIGIWVEEGKLASRILELAQDPEAVVRYGGLSLGESRDLVDEVKLSPQWPEGEKGRWLVRDARGNHPLPVWVDHIGSKGTRWEQFRVREQVLQTPPRDDLRWITICPPQGGGGCA